MLLTLTGCATSRRDARRLFGLRPNQGNYRGSRLSDVASAALAGGLGRRARWVYYSAFNRIRAALNKQSLPTILWFGIRHPRTGCHAKHFAVVVDVQATEIRLLDPLGKPPATALGFNVSIPVKSAGRGRRSSSPLGPYLVAERQEAALLIWRR